MRKYCMYEILENISKMKKPEDKINALRLTNNPALKALLKYAYDPKIKFLLPTGEAPFKPTSFLDQEARLFTEVRRLYLFIEGGNPNLTKLKRESLFIQLLESIDPRDAKLINCVKDKKLPFKGITVKIVSEAFPGLISEGAE